MESTITPFGENLKKKIHVRINDYKASLKERHQDLRKVRTTFFDRDGNEKILTAKNLQEFFYDPLILFTPTVLIFDSDEKWLQYCKLYPKRSRNGQAIIQPDFQKRLQITTNLSDSEERERNNTHQKKFLGSVPLGRSNMNPNMSNAQSNHKSTTQNKILVQEISALKNKFSRIDAPMVNPYAKATSIRKVQVSNSKKNNRSPADPYAKKNS
eukprot:scaffold45818_cov56-Cyclotella_meneghiniana.AAC.1